MTTNWHDIKQNLMDNQDSVESLAPNDAELKNSRVTTTEKPKKSVVSQIVTFLVLSTCCFAVTFFFMSADSSPKKKSAISTNKMSFFQWFSGDEKTEKQKKYNSGMPKLYGDPIDPKKLQSPFIEKPMMDTSGFSL